MGTFYKYYCGLKKPPCLTIVIGGNHEASTHMRELFIIVHNLNYLDILEDGLPQIYIILVLLDVSL
jgi:hypothetical protein